MTGVILRPDSRRRRLHGGSRFARLLADAHLLDPTVVFVAAHDAPDWQKACADYVCAGHRDDEVIQAAVDSLPARVVEPGDDPSDLHREAW